MGSCTFIRESNAFRPDSGRIVQVKIAEFRSTSDCDGALHDQEVARNDGTPNYQQLKTAVKLHVGQMMRNHNFKVGNDVMERGSVTKSQKGNKAHVERRVGECLQWKAHGQCSKGDSYSFSHDSLFLDTEVVVRDERTIVFSCIPLEGRTD